MSYRRERWIVRDSYDKDMADEATKFKNLRRNKLAAFTRKKTQLQGLVDKDTSASKLEEVHQELKAAFAAIEAAHDNYACVVDEADLEAEGDYLGPPSEVLHDMDDKVTRRLAVLNLANDASAQQKKVDQKKLKLKNSIDSFGTPSTLLTEWVSANSVSHDDMRKELVKVEGSFEVVYREKLDLLNSGSSEDFTELMEQFDTLVLKELDKCKTVALDYMKNAAPTTTGAGASEGVSARGGFSTTKRETVMLPQFSGEEKTAYLSYPVWRQQWDLHIVEYEEKYRPTMLLNHLDEKAKHQIVGLESDYDKAIKQLDSYYGDSKKVIRACLDDLRSQSQITQHDYKSLVQYKKCILNNYARLKSCKLDHEMSNTAAMGVLIRKLPITEAVEWQKFLAERDKSEQDKPFPAFIQWLEKVGTSWEMLAASGTGVKGKTGVQVHHTFYGEEDFDSGSKTDRACYKCGKTGHLKKDCTQKADRKSTGGGKTPQSNVARKPRLPLKHKKFYCAFHKDAAGRNCVTWSCPSMKYTPYADRLKLLRENLDCEICCGDCPKGNCLAKQKRICGGNKDGRGCGINHVGHELFCANAKLCFLVSEETVMRAMDETDNAVLLQVMKITSLDGSTPYETVLWDSACSGLFVRDEHARQKKFPFKNKQLRVVTLGGDVKEVDSRIYDCQVKDLQGNVYHFQAHGLETITGSLNTRLSEELMDQLFPSIKGGYRMCGAETVDYLIGLGKASWQPQRSVKAVGGGDFWVWQNQFGSCVGGSHPLVGNYVSRSDSLFTVLKVVDAKSILNQSLTIPTCSSFKSRISPVEAEDFFKAEQLCTTIEPKCGSCRCGKCPVPGSRYSMREENELKLIEENLRYDEIEKKWVAGYPYLFPRNLLKGSREVAMRSMLATERMLKKNTTWGTVYQDQIQDMLDRGVAKVVSSEELAKYQGVINYIPHLAVSNPRSASTPVRICFDASRSQGGGPSLNKVLAKGPDSYLNNLAGVILRFRNGVHAAKGDVRKMYNSVALEIEDCFVQCFLWRNLDAGSDPLTYQVVVNNIGVKPAGCIASLALYKSADRFEDQYPVTTKQLKDNSYVDDLGLTGKTKAEVIERTIQADQILAHANMKIKRWVFSGDSGGGIEIGDTSSSASLEEVGTERMLGIIWEPTDDVFHFHVRINLSTLKKKSRMGPDISKQELIENPPSVITRRQYYSQVQSLFDPIGLLSPIMLRAKLLLRKTWENDCSKLAWDDPLPAELVREMVSFFVELFELETIVFPRSLLPKDQEVVGKPDLVIFSDGSILAFGSVAYVRWKLKSGLWWSRLLLSKSKIAPRNRVTVPRLELNGALLSKRLEDFIHSDLDLDFGNVYHLVDSSTVLGYLHKSDAKLKPYEGVRVSEVQAAGKFVNNRLQNWSWIEGPLNPADWATKPRQISDLCENGFWQSGPKFLQEDYSNWPIKLDFRVDKLEGELVLKENHIVMFISEELVGYFGKLLDRTSDAKKLFRIVAYAFKWIQLVKREDTAEVLNILSPNVLYKARLFWIKVAQRDLSQDVQTTKKLKSGKLEVEGRFQRLAPFEDTEGIWRVGVRIREFTPFTQDHQPPALLPYGHRLTFLLMRNAHEVKHGGVSETVCQFRLSGYWVVKANQLARKIKTSCVICRYLDHHPIQQVMGSVPANRLISPSAWSDVQLDLFGPYECRSDVNKRSTKKVWGIIIVDTNCGAIHCDTLQDYSAQETLKALRRFGSLRGWPRTISSDPGSQLQTAAGTMVNWFEHLRGQLSDQIGTAGFVWQVSPADSPWRQGKSEVSIKMVKRLLKIAVGTIRLTPSELQTALFEIADICNNRPIGINRTPDSNGVCKVLTPNCLLMGRALNKVPDDEDIIREMKKIDRYELIQQVARDFWARWVTEVTPLHVVRQKWHQTQRNLAKGDIVLVHANSPIKGKYTVAKVDSVNVSDDGKVRSCSVVYRIPNNKDSIADYTGGKLIKLTRSVQRLTLLLSKEEQEENMEVVDGVVKVEKPEVS